MKKFAHSPSGRCSICVLSPLPQLGVRLGNEIIAEWIDFYERVENTQEKAAFHRRGYQQGLHNPFILASFSLLGYSAKRLPRKAGGRERPKPTLWH